MRNADGSGIEDTGRDEQGEIDEIEGELMFYAHPLMYDWLVQAFNKKYPNVKVTFSHGSNSENALYLEYAMNVPVDLMSGTAGDVIDPSGLPYRKYGENNLLEDLYPFMENDPEFRKEDYYTNIFEGMEQDGKLWVMPGSFLEYLVRFNKTLLEDHQIKEPQGASVNYKELTDLFHKIAPNNDKLIMAQYRCLMNLEGAEYTRYFDVKHGRVSFQSPEFVEFLNEMKRIDWPSEREVEIAGSRFYGWDYWDRAEENDLCLLIASDYTNKENVKVFYEHPSNLTSPIPLSVSNGDYYYLPYKALAIPSTSKNKELAWKFIRFSIEEKPLELLQDSGAWKIIGMPINRNNTLKCLESVFGDGREEAVHTIDGWNSKLNTIGFFGESSLLYEEIKKITAEFYGGRMTAEECAKQIQERAEIYLKE